MWLTDPTVFQFSPDIIQQGLHFLTNIGLRLTLPGKVIRKVNKCVVGTCHSI